jgi:hypothetical protein
MLCAKLRSSAVDMLSSSVLVAPALSDELADSLASIRRAMVGHWTGQVSGSDANGDKFEGDDAFTFVVTSEDGLSSATWSADALEIATHEGDGLIVYVIGIEPVGRMSFGTKCGSRRFQTLQGMELGYLRARIDDTPFNSLDIRA